MTKKLNLVGSTWEEDVEQSTDSIQEAQVRTLEYARHPGGRIAKVFLVNSKGLEVELEIDEGTARALGHIFDQPVEVKPEATIDELMSILDEV